MGMKVVIVFIVGVAAGLFLGSIIFSGFFIEKLQEADLSKIPQLSLVGYSEANVSVAPGFVLLTNECKRLSMVVSLQQSQSIAEGLTGELGFRPTSHDTVREILNSYGIDVLMVKVEDLKDGTYYSHLVVMHENNILNLDSRPSDAIAIAVRSGAPVYVKDSLLQEHGQEVC
jgi:bifunctional DNase/RNase